MKKDDDFNIFSAAGKPAPKKKLASSKKPTPLPAEKTPAAPPSSAAKPQTPAGEKGDVESMLSRIKELQDNLQKQLESIYAKTGINPRKLDDAIVSAKGTPAFEKIENDMRKLEEELNKIVPKRKTKSALPGLKAKSDQDRKGKTLGARKKWIPIR